jgi:hypothetical protein
MNLGFIVLLFLMICESMQQFMSVLGGSRFLAWFFIVVIYVRS